MCINHLEKTREALHREIEEACLSSVFVLTLSRELDRLILDFYYSHTEDER